MLKFIKKQIKEHRDRKLREKMAMIYIPACSFKEFYTLYNFVITGELDKA